MKLFDRSTEVESIDISYRNGKRYSIWMPKEVHLALKLMVEEDEDAEELFTREDLNCTVDIHCTAKWDDINMIEE